MTLLLLTTLLAAETQNDKLIDTLLGFLPILLFLGILYFLFRRQTNSPAAKLLREERERHIQHMQKMEELAERIAKALERNQ
jgi:ATP-dependent Zn protease